MQQYAKVYSYLRFSDPKQADGGSVDRQLSYARRWAADNNVPLDESLSMRDEGLSAYHQRHVSQGAFGVFLKAVEDGMIPTGSVLIVEGLDRLSRAEPMVAQAQLIGIVMAGITVITAMDRQEYNRDLLKREPHRLFVALAMMIRAYEESDTKSKRVSDSIRRRCEAWIAGTNRRIIRSGADPSWLKWDAATETWQEIPDNAAAIRKLIDLYLKGYGTNGIVDQMGENHFMYNGRPMPGGRMYEMMRLPALGGTKRLKIGDDEYELKDYYPALLSEAQFAELQTALARRVRSRVGVSSASVLTGYKRTFCGYCGMAIVSQTIATRRRKSDGKLTDGSRRIQCSSRLTRLPCDVVGGLSAVPIERAVMSYCADQMNLNALYKGADRSTPIRDALSLARHEVAEIELQLGRIVQALAEGTGAAPAIIVKKAAELEARLSDARAKVTAAEYELAAMSPSLSSDAAAEWQALYTGVLDYEYEPRLKARELMMTTFERIVIYFQGVDRSTSEFIDLLLVARGGGSRFLRIDRRTGEWVAGEALPPQDVLATLPEGMLLPVGDE
ncbi:recombinase family protein [Chitinimonas arctica]|uniref:Recombinase family protein n=1 Tax=Chitinimonas arctica TaxID=2594795 RepID=A0A516SHR9_9NEIS|nr:recombinase family protein [Chitinimonas arctica]QDQ27675.1 recombinase family protein [Chitinimonas arctica]